MQTATAEVSTRRASRYFQQLCKHWSHKFEATFDEHSGTIRFDTDRSASFKATEDKLRIDVFGGDDEILQRLETVVTDHLQRFAGEEKLSVNFTPS